MARRTFYATRDLKNPGYGTRMLRAGDPVELDAPKARLYLALGAVSPTKPKGVATAPPVQTPPPAAPTATAPKRKAAPRKKATKKAK